MKVFVILIVMALVAYASSQGYNPRFQGQSGSQGPTGGYMQRGFQGGSQGPSGGYMQRGSQGGSQGPSGGYMQRGSQGGSQGPTGGYMQRGSQGGISHEGLYGRLWGLGEWDDGVFENFDDDWFMPE